MAKTALEELHRLIGNDMYVDDFLCGCSTVEEAEILLRRRSRYEPFTSAKKTLVVLF